MESQRFRRVFSEERVRKYLDAHPNDEGLAIDHYVLNIEISESFYSLLSLHEVCLRNKIDRELMRHFRTDSGTVEWQEVFQTGNTYTELGDEVRKAKRRARRNRQRDRGRRTITRGEVIAELNEEYQEVLWQPLRRGFSEIPPRERQRRPIAVELNHIRRFRNRIFHQEPISWNSTAVEQYHSQILSSIKKMDTNVWYMALEKAKRCLPNQW